MDHVEIAPHCTMNVEAARLLGLAPARTTAKAPARTKADHPSERKARGDAPEHPGRTGRPGAVRASTGLSVFDRTRCGERTTGAADYRLGTMYLGGGARPYD